jgi:5-oxoprolinase (ATP-hydrolysing)
VVFRKRVDDGEVTLVSVYPEGVGNPIPGLFGGLPGAGARGRVIDAAGETVIDCGTGRLVELADTRHRVEMVLAGGSGYGPPAERDPAALARDIALGLVSPEAARTLYGPVQAAEPVK